ncbi:aminotransferase class I/II-fold pyridoxal phosphate-dependent enzyme [Lentilitoribacter sp. EG35]|jgi:7-keto-8-aminopelargonate synthetase-like enzyme|uniref:8-amino-7-oxononanoate synthase family protein n=1 Tax=Lentilitoribacter sp. EG35 TaxID=3234192 RepID=UPI0034611813
MPHNQQIATDEQKKFRNTAKLINLATPSFQRARNEGLMGVYGKSMKNREVLCRQDNGPDKNLVDFVRCSYLGLDNHPSIARGAVEAIEQYGSVHWSCARTRLNFSLLGDLEDELSALFQARVTAYSTVLAANMGALPILASGHLTDGIKPTMVFDRLAHATLAFHKPVVAQDTMIHTIGHNDLNALEDICKINEKVAYICDGVYSMGGSAPIADLLRLQDKYGLFLYIDDAHGISLYGKNGEGYARSQIAGELGSNTIIAASLGKGFGASGGILMLGTQEQEQIFRDFSIAHAFSASLNLAAVGAGLASAAIHHTQELPDLQQALRTNIQLFDSMVNTEQRNDTLPIRTVQLGSTEKAIATGRALIDAGYYTSAIFFPTVAQEKSGLRICPTATHTAEQILGIGNKLNELKQCTISSAA